MYLILILIGVIILLQAFKVRCRNRARELERQAQEIRWDEQQRARDVVLLAGLFHVIRRSKEG